jgi:hypothetical protein
MNYFYSENMRPIDYIYLYLTFVVAAFALWRIKGAWEKFKLTDTWQNQMEEPNESATKRPPPAARKGAGKRRR